MVCKLVTINFRYQILSNQGCSRFTIESEGCMSDVSISGATETIPNIESTG